LGDKGEGTDSSVSWLLQQVSEDLARVNSIKIFEYAFVSSKKIRLLMLSQFGESGTFFYFDVNVSSREHMPFLQRISATSNSWLLKEPCPKPIP